MAYFDGRLPETQTNTLQQDDYHATPPNHTRNLRRNGLFATGMAGLLTSTVLLTGCGSSTEASDTPAVPPLPTSRSYTEAPPVEANVPSPTAPTPTTQRTVILKPKPVTSCEQYGKDGFDPVSLGTESGLTFHDLNMLVNEKAVNKYTYLYGDEFTSRLNIGRMLNEDKAIVLNKYTVAGYQCKIWKAYQDKALANILGNPPGFMNAQTARSAPRSEVGGMITSGTDGYLSTIATAINDPKLSKTPGVDMNLLDIATFDPDLKGKYRAAVAAGATDFPFVLKADVVGVNQLGNGFDVVTTVGKFSDGATRLSAVQLVPVGQLMPYMESDDFIGITIYRHTFPKVQYLQ